MAKISKSVTLVAILGLVVAVLLFGAPVGYQFLLKSSQEAQRNAEIANIIPNAEQRISDRLKDPSSAQFRNVFVSENGHYVCGEVNSKNGFGGYTGFKHFVVTGTDTSHQLSEADMEMFHSNVDSIEGDDNDEFGFRKKLRDDICQH